MAVCEAFARIAGLAPPVYAVWLENEDSFYRHSSNPALPYELKPEFSRKLHTGFTSVNAHGMRDRERTLHKPADTRRILLLGDSVAEGIRVHSDEATVARKLENLIPGDTTEVLNLAVTGYNTLAEIELLRDKGLPFDPDIVVLLFVRNDFENASLSPDSAVAAPPRPTWVKKLFVSSHLWRHLCLRFHLWEFGRKNQAVAQSGITDQENNVVRGLRILRKLANEHDFQVLVAVWPEFNDNALTDPHPVANAPEELIIERLAGTFGMPTTRLSPPFTTTGKRTTPRRIHDYTTPAAATESTRWSMAAKSPPPPFGPR